MEPVDHNVRAESGRQLLARLSTRPSLCGLDQRLLGNGPSFQDVIEVTGEASVGKSMLLLQWVSRAILPPSAGGLGVGVLFIDTDHHNLLHTLVNLLEAQIKFHVSTVTPQQRLTSTAAESAIKDALKRLTILNAYDSTQLYTSLLSLEKMLQANPLISMVMIDSLSAFFWADRLSGGLQHMDSYLRRLLTAVQKNTQQHKVPVVFSRPSHFQSAFRSKGKDGLGESSIFISLSVNETAMERGTENKCDKIIYTAFVRTAFGCTSHNYFTSKDGFVWM